MLQPAPEATVIRPTGSGQFTAVVLDAGRETSAFLQLDITAAGGEIVDALYCEHVDNRGDVILKDPLTIGSRMSVADRYRCRPGRQTHEFFWWKGFRYVLLVFRDVRKPLTMHQVTMNFTSYPVEERGSFDCSDPRLNEIWRTGRYTLQLCMHDSYMDCPWREQAQWLGDARIQGLVNVYTFGDGRLMRRLLRQGAQSQTPLGPTLGVFPSRQHHCLLPDFSLQWVSAHWDYYWYTGDDTIFAETYDAIARLLNWFIESSEPGVLPGPAEPGIWLFLDWSPIYKDDLNATYAMQYLEALRTADRIAAHLGRSADARRWNNQARRVAQAIVRTFWNPQKRLFAEGYDRARRQRIAQAGQHANSLAILLDLQQKHSDAIAENVLCRIARTQARRTFDPDADAYVPSVKSPAASPYFYKFVLEAMFYTRHDRQAVRAIGDLWGAMLDQGYTTFYESWGHPQAKGGSSACHAWSASPTAMLSAFVGGIRPAAPGWQKVWLDPRPAGLDEATVVVPTPHGAIRSHWRRRNRHDIQLEVTLPADVIAKVRGHKSPLKSGRHTLVVPA